MKRALADFIVRDRPIPVVMRSIEAVDKLSVESRSGWKISDENGNTAAEIISSFFDIKLDLMVKDLSS